MRIDEWEFADRTHPVYERPPADTRWPVGLPGQVPAEYTQRWRDLQQDPLTVEPLQMDTVGYPSVDVYRTPAGRTIQKIILRSQYTQDIDVSGIERLAREWMHYMRFMSLGPYSLRLLRKMGHPYGYGKAGSAPSWERLGAPRRVPRMGRLAYIRGIRGRVSDRSLVNLQSGEFWRAWSWRLLRWHGGLTLLVLNPTPQAWWLAHGTYRMQAHGPWATVAKRMLPRMHAAWRLAAYHAWRRGVQRAKALQAALEGQFGEDVDNDEAADAGGFS